MGRDIQDLTGRRFGKLTAVKFIGVKNHHAYWLFQCDCGKTKIRTKPQKGQFASCGCEKTEELKTSVEPSYVSSPEADDWMFGNGEAIRRLRRMFK